MNGSITLSTSVGHLTVEKGGGVPKTEGLCILHYGNYILHSFIMTLEAPGEGATKTALNHI